MKRQFLPLALTVFLTSGALFVNIGAAHAAPLQVLSKTLISASSTGDPGNFSQKYTTMTPDARYVAFVSSSNNLVPGVTMPMFPSADVPALQTLLYDRHTSTMEVVSRSTSGDIGDRHANGPISISSDGRYVLFSSESTNLVPGYTDGRYHVYLRDRQMHTTVAIESSQAASFADAHAMSGDGNLIVYDGTASAADYNYDGYVFPYSSDCPDCASHAKYLYNRTTGATTPLPGARRVSISRDGRYVTSKAPATAPGGSGFGMAEYRYEVATGNSTQFTGAINDNAGGAVLNADGSYAVFYASAMADGASYDLHFVNAVTGQEIYSHANTFAQEIGLDPYESLSISDDHQYVSYATTDHATGNFGWVANTATAEKVAVDDSIWWKATSMQLSGGGVQVAFTSNAQPGPPQVYVAKVGDLTPPDATPPTISYTMSPTPNAAGWNKSNTAVTFTCTDADSGVASCSPPVTVSTEGASNQVAGTATDNAGNTASTTATVKLDKTAPTVGTPTMTTTFILFSANETISATASDALSGVAGGEYYIDTDPGVGNGTAMTYANGKITATKTINGGLSVGQHKLYVRTRDAAGNWSAPKSVTFFYV